MSGKRDNPFYQAQDILSRRDHAEAEIRQKLARKGFAEDQIASTVERLKEMNFLNDARFARTYVESLLVAKAVGPRWLHHKLKSRGVASDIASAAIDEALAGDREAELLTTAATRWQRTHLRHRGDRQRLHRFLLSRGFSSDQISAFLSHLDQEAS